MFIDDQNPGQGGAGVAEDTTEESIETSEETTEEVTNDTSSGDPLDDIKDPEARAEAKKARAIARRKTDTTEPTKPDTQPDVASKKDLAKIVTTEAKKLVPEEIKEVWDELYDIPLDGFDPLDADSIAQNMEDRYQIYLRRNPDKVDPTKDLTTSTGIKTAGGKKSEAKNEKPLPGWKEPVQPEDWFPPES